MKIVEKVWGRETWIANNRLYCGKILELKKGFRCSIHKHKIKDETFYVLAGAIFLETFDEIGHVYEDNYMGAGASKRIIPKTYHRFTGLTDAQIIEFSTHHEDNDSYRLSVSGKVPDDEMAQICEKAGVPF